MGGRKYLVLGPVAIMVPVTAVEVSEKASENIQGKARSWAQFLSVPLEVKPFSESGSNPHSTLSSSDSFRLEVSETAVRLLDSRGRALEIDFLNDHLNYQRKGLRGKNELLAKALGGAKATPRVLDLSAGLGIDAVYMTQLGFKVTAVERSKVLFILLDEALSKVPELQTSLDFVCAEALTFLREATAPFEFEGIYFDPMYPHKKKTALPKQEMVVFRELVGQDEDAVEVLKEALKTSARRIVVKRPVGAPGLMPGVRHVYEGKVVRYDVYMR
jgi:16S rRNA (guanine1516-N2)-methyltransferase